MADELQFDADTHTYSVGGRTLPGVTELLRPLESFEKIPPAVLERARQFGSHVHMACHLDNLGELDEETLSQALLPYLLGWRQFRADRALTIHHSERPVYHHKLRYAGTPDVVGSLDRTTCVIDIKSGIVPRSVGPQTAAYAELLQPEFGPMLRYCLQLRSDGSYRLLPQRSPVDRNIFFSCLNLWKWWNP